MYRIKFMTKNGTLCVMWDEKLRRSVRRIERKGGTVVFVAKMLDEGGMK